MISIISNLLPFLEYFPQRVCKADPKTSRNSNVCMKVNASSKELKVTLVANMFILI